MVASDDDDVAVAIGAAGPYFGEGFEPVERPLDLGSGAAVGEVAGVDEEVAWWEALTGDLGVCVGDADDADGLAATAGFGCFVGWAAQVEDEVVEKGDEGGEWVMEAVVEERWWREWRCGWAEEGEHVVHRRWVRLERGALGCILSGCLGTGGTERLLKIGQLQD